MTDITIEFARQDDCLYRIVPSGLRLLVAERDQLRDRIAQLEARNAELLQALIDAAQSLATISKLAGKDEFMRDLTDTRSYAKSRAGEALRALTQPSGRKEEEHEKA